ncbi:MAG: metallophosphoesterase family protein [Chitinophagales bacterium]|nr:metallophosphoesterase family protein [Chitinophagaceae bacterium]MCB9065123.1 metallophosphoesterase family protein [Chitinophagales bacterium]
MKIALFSDIHANLPALETVLADIDNKKPDAVYCLGDLVGYNIWPNEVCKAIRERGIPTIAGNYDQGVGLNINECGCAYKNEEDKANGNISISYTNEVMNDRERAYLRTLPAHIRVEYKLGDDMDMLLVHGSPRRINEYLFEDRDEKSLLRIMSEANADVMCFGHTHLPYHRVVEDVDNKKFRHAINLGSVGKPKDGDPRACYVMLEINEHYKTSDPNSLNVEFVRLDYDVEKAAKAVEDSPLPDKYADILRKAY